jgi:hypothetical protein
MYVYMYVCTYVHTYIRTFVRTYSYGSMYACTYLQLVRTHFVRTECTVTAESDLKSILEISTYKSLPKGGIRDVYLYC